MQKNNNNYLHWILNDKYRVFFHLLFWMFIYLSDVLSLFGLLEPGIYDWIFFTILFMDVFIVYFNLYFLIPKLLLKQKYLLYIAATIITILINSFLSFYLTYPWEEVGIADDLDVPYYIDFTFGAFEGTLYMLVLAISIRLLKIVVKNQFTITDLENTNLKTELTFLKNQINPHFLFNALNNIYVQTRKKSKDAPESVLLLSELLRYQLYDCAKDKVYLRNELEYLKNYIALEKMRRTDADITLHVQGDPNGKMIAPFLFISFIENAVKHGLELHQKGFIKIDFEVLDDSLNFKVVNNKVENPQVHKDGGIGLVNVKRRLELLYPQKHTLEIKNTSDLYTVRLSIHYA